MEDFMGFNKNPLYEQVRQALRQSIVEGKWQVAEALPSEIELAKHFEVSQGTMRKAINMLVDEKILTRRQGKGTYVAQVSAQDSLRNFFRFKLDGSDCSASSCKVMSIKVVKPNQALKKYFDARSNLIAIERTRTIGEQEALLEIIHITKALFDGLEQLGDLPNTLYDFYAKCYGHSVHHVRDCIGAVNANAHVAEVLGLSQGEAILKVKRLAYGLDDQLLEHRVSFGVPQCFYECNIN